MARLNDGVDRAFKLFHRFRVSKKGDASARFKAIERARHELIGARNYFECVTEPELIDIAIYSLKTAQLKYEYLLRNAKRENMQSALLMKMVTRPD